MSENEAKAFDIVHHEITYADPVSDLALARRIVACLVEVGLIADDDRLARMESKLDEIIDYTSGSPAAHKRIRHLIRRTNTPLDTMD